MTKQQRVSATAERIRHKMIERGLNNNSLAEAAGVRASVISRIFSEHRDLKSSTLAGIAKALHCTSDELLGLRPLVAENQVEKARKLVAQLDNVLWDH